MGISPEKKKDFKAQLIDFLLFFFFFKCIWRLITSETKASAFSKAREFQENLSIQISQSLSCVAKYPNPIS